MHHDELMTIKSSMTGRIIVSLLYRLRVNSLPAPALSSTCMPRRSPSRACMSACAPHTAQPLVLEPALTHVPRLCRSATLTCILATSLHAAARCPSHVRVPLPAGFAPRSCLRSVPSARPSCMHVLGRLPHASALHARAWPSCSLLPCTTTLLVFNARWSILSPSVSLLSLGTPASHGH
jgi:hypothetical protein